jgi:CBS domain containing-hemolysin-like protein
MFTYVLLIWLVLRYRQLQNRFLQTASALFGVDLLILILQSLVVLVAMTPIIKPLASLLSLLTLIALVWQFFVKSYILGQALNIGRWLAFLVILLCLFIASFIGFSAAGVNVMERVQKLTEQMTQSNNLPASKPPTEPAQQSGLISS